MKTLHHLAREMEGWVQDVLEQVKERDEELYEDLLPWERDVKHTIGELYSRHDHALDVHEAAHSLAELVHKLSGVPKEGEKK